MLMLYSWSRSGRRYGLPQTAPRASTGSWGLSTGRDSARSRRSRPRRRGDHGPVFVVGRSASLETAVGRFLVRSVIFTF
jgi:hypothetical protein